MYLYSAVSRPTLVDGFEEPIEDIFAGDCMSIAIGRASSDKLRQGKNQRAIYGWGWNKYNMLFVDNQRVKTKKVFTPYKIDFGEKGIGQPPEDDTNTYEVAFNLTAPSELMYYHYKNNKVNKLQEHEKKIDKLHSENFKLRKEKKRLEDLLKTKTEEMLGKFLKHEEKIKLVERVDEDEVIRDLNKMIKHTK